MTKKERIQAVLKGESVDRPPVSLWRHFHLSEQQPEPLATALLAHQNAWEWDWIQVTFRETFYGEAWGCTYSFGEDEDTPPAPYTTRIVLPDAFEDLQVLDPGEAMLGEYLTCLRNIRRGREGDVPFLMTIHSPLCVADLILGDPRRTLWIMREHPESLKKGLETIAATLGSFVVECLRSTGVAGVLFTIPVWATLDYVTLEEYNEFGRAFDLLVFQLIQDSHFNILQVNGDNSLLMHLSDYPVQVLSWPAEGENNPTVSEVIENTDKIVLAGVNEQGTLVSGSPEEVVAEAEAAVEAADGKRVIIGPSAPYPGTVPEANLRALSEWAHSRDA